MKKLGLGCFTKAIQRSTFFAFNCLCLVLSSHAQTLKVGYFELQPHAYQVKPGEHGGAAVEMFRLVAQKMGVAELSLQRLPLSRMTVMLAGGEIDAVLFIGKNPERAAKFYYPDTPYYASQPGLIVAAHSPLSTIQRVEDLKGVRIGTTQDGLMSTTMKNPDLNLEPLAGDEVDTRNIQKLVRGRLDAVYSADMSVLAYTAKLAAANVRAIPLPDPANPIFTAFNKTSASIWSAKYATALAAVIKERGEYGKGFLK